MAPPFIRKLIMTTTTNKGDKLALLIATEIAATESKAFADMALSSRLLPKSENTTDKAIAAAVDAAKAARLLEGEEFSPNMATDWKNRIGAARAFLIADSYGVNEPRVITLTAKTTEAQARAAAVVLNDAFVAARKAAAVLESRYRLADVPSEHARKVYLRDLSAKAAALATLAAKDKDGKATKDAGKALIAMQTESGMIAFLAAMYEAKSPAPVAAPAAPAAPVAAPVAAAPVAAAPVAAAPAAPVATAPAAPAAPAAPVADQVAAAPVAAAPAAPAAPVALPKISGASDRNVQDVPTIRDRAAFTQAIAQVAAYAVAHNVKAADLAKMIADQMAGQAKRKAADLPGELA
jgi:hypothetical protein